MRLKSKGKLLLIAAALLLLPAGLAACGKSSSSSAGAGDKAYTPKKLTVEFVPSSNAGTIEAKAKPLEGLLKKELGIPVTVSVSTDYNTIVEAMGSKKVDVGFLPPDAYVLAHKQYGDKVLLQAQRYGVSEPDDKTTKKLVNYYRSQILVRKDSGIKSIKDLKGKKIAVQDTTSTAGWIYPAVEMLKHGVNINKSGIQTVTVKGHDQGVLSVYNKNTDAAFVFQGARKLVMNDEKDVMSKVVPIYTTAKIPNDTITVRGDMSGKWQKKIATAFKNIAKTKKGHAIISSVYSHEGYVDSKDSNFDIIRQYDKQAKQLDK
ncbi:MAG: phosphate/phosphite/phosphonate ABC transporter substrate-binding protein [Levilactobacillus sp.]|jgi:phosphonate transport system substrate-binding protein|uniref:phosphate/phosphite/phosphonate ABC transporter substrate-binding protein n=1 Tax=Levilactobacillus sp. TaxID=2767919 RepID=UPI00258C941F|nr:phosphate/phosphite/phosphonate ABC transporter substrate-binding protein [Levilactobacillus sp.]MCI1553493.1 phosphate/phosphite/phosphonate ABC transporter substrate-binding protein [Levilactobacillus sp.]MCI1597882.1 phosphate/phosphite/phosphonate ABC transporter substrate-binding protein [Levilactobacillus sp.]MCI1606221.1 phosphate/phosphite/phosphonate ABC transporter substrate-binding protein [Levilactobacillus sp.]